MEARNLLDHNSILWVTRQNLWGCHEDVLSKILMSVVCDLIGPGALHSQYALFMIEQNILLLTMM